MKDKITELTHEFVTEILKTAGRGHGDVDLIDKFIDKINALTEPVSEEAMMVEARKFLKGDTPDIQKGVKTMHWAAYRMAQFALYRQPKFITSLPPER